MILKENTKMANISLQTLIKECSLPTVSNEYLYNNFSLGNRHNIHEIFRYQKFNYDFTDYLAIYNDGEHLLGNFRASYDNFLYFVSRILNVTPKENLKDDEDLTKEWLKQIQKLEQITTEEELKKEFPILYDDLIHGREFIDSIEKQPRKTKLEKEEYEKKRHYYYACGLKRNLQNFITTQIEVYKRFTIRRKDYKECIKGKNYNKYIYQYFDMEKVALYVIHTYLNICESKEGQKIKGLYLPILEKYQQGNHPQDIRVRTEEGIITSYTESLRIDRILRDAINKKEEQVSWVLVQEGYDCHKKVKESTKKARTTKMPKEEVERLKTIGKEKQAFYEKTKPAAIVSGRLQHKGYIGYIYPNGEILLDKEYNEKSPSSITGNAIYHLNVINFKELSKLTKTELRNHPETERIIHTKNKETWQDKVKEIITRDNGKEMEEASKEFIQKIKEKRL